MKPTRNDNRSASSPYSAVDGPLILRDVLAIDRTRMANERTLLAWLRTALMMLVSGITLIKLFGDILAMQATGMALVPLAIATGVLGLSHYVRLSKVITAVEAEQT
jgi:putative membrane protein